MGNNRAGIKPQLSASLQSQGSASVTACKILADLNYHLSYISGNIDTQIILNHVKIYLDSTEVFLLIK